MDEGKQSKFSAPGDPFQEWLILSDAALVMLIPLFGSEQRDERNQRVLEALKMIGLFNFMRTVFKWQKFEICTEFVLRWNQVEKKTFVNDVEIDVSFEAFRMATGLLAEESAMDEEDAKQQRGFELCAGNVWERRDNRNTAALEEFEDPWLRDLLVLLSTTVWMKVNYPHRVPSDLVESVTDALSGKRVRWSRSLYNKFVCEIRRLQSVSQRHHAVGSLQPLKTVAGPMMGYLYIQAKLKTELNGLFLDTEKKIKKEAVECLEGESLPRDYVQKSEDRDEDCCSSEDYSRRHRDSRRPTPLRTNSPELQISDSDYRAKRSKFVDLNIASDDLPESPSVKEDLVLKVLELECVIARQNLELAESRLRLYLNEKTSC